MKKITEFFIIAFCVFTAAPAFSQTYKAAADTAKLNAEYIKVSNDITSLSAALDKAKEEQSKRTTKAASATADAQNTADKTSDKASQSTGESVKDARRAKKEARRSVKDAKDARHAKSNLDDANRKVEKLTNQLQKKQDRLKELDAMRSSIGSGTPQ